MALLSRFGASAGLIAALSMVSTPTLAAELPQGLVTTPQGSAVFSDFDTTSFDTTTFDSETDIAEWRDRGWRRGGWRRHRGVDAGDVIAGVLILGGIAAVANAANNNNRRRERDVVIVERDDRRYDRREEWRDERRDDWRDDRRDYRRDGSSRGLGSAVDQCVAEIEQDARVDSVNSADRTSRGWVVTGSLFNGTSFTCAIDNNGQIDAIEYGDFRGSSYDAPRQDRRAAGQYDDDTYRAARLTMDDALSGNGPRVLEATGRRDEPLREVDGDLRPAYPGGPLPGENFPE